MFLAFRLRKLLRCVFIRETVGVFRLPFLTLTCGMFCRYYLPDVRIIIDRVVVLSFWTGESSHLIELYLDVRFSSAVRLPVTPQSSWDLPVKSVQLRKLSERRSLLSRPRLKPTHSKA
ncbi:hypothetical protein RvY_15443 [Ramazzottius varieornatus]|uniref:Uncharacterized protein n=1 Tax=Ramazzottius varieornatus TaxID=947166 RepID=A0A1D1VZL7_RAMVA|nr:hypothetical protein RvY_15443 [Ramazzottius varieornatus]